MSTDNAYADLGLAPGASEAEVKAAWRRLVSRWHPDRNPSAQAVGRMQRINQAFETIRLAGFSLAPEAAAPTAQESAQEAADEHEAPTPRRTLHRKLKVTLEEAALGCTRTLQGRITDPCPACEGAKFRVLGGACPQCRGSGAVRERAWFGWAATSIECGACAGSGVAREPCPACTGSGKADELRYKFSVRIPAGVRDGDVLFVDGHRHRARALPGDFDIRIEVEPHAFFQLDDDGTVRCEAPIDGFAWIGGRTVELPTLDGLHKVALRRDRLSYRLERRGFPVQRRGERGDCIVNVLPTFPDPLSADQQILLDQLIATSSGGPSGDDRLSQWNGMLRSWQRSLHQRARKREAT